MKSFLQAALKRMRVTVAAMACLSALFALNVLGVGNAYSAAISENREIEIGDELTLSMLEGAKLVNNERAQEYVNQVGRWLTSGTERADLPWQFGIMDRPEMGSYPLPGGKVLITVGMLRKLKDEAELAGVLAHEIAHVVKRHQLQAIPTGNSQASLGAITIALDPALEFEADRMAVVIMARAGYDPNAYLNVLKKFQNDRSNDQGLSVLSAVHPPFKDRIAQLQPVVGKIAVAAQASGVDKGRARFAAFLGLLKVGAR
jgi:predicted Zn-dependent protease